jgi:hypothetical protein
MLTPYIARYSTVVAGLNLALSTAVMTGASYDDILAVASHMPNLTGKCLDDEVFTPTTNLSQDWHTIFCASFHGPFDLPLTFLRINTTMG